MIRDSIEISPKKQFSSILLLSDHSYIHDIDDMEKRIQKRAENVEFLLNLFSNDEIMEASDSEMTGYLR